MNPAFIVWLEAAVCRCSANNVFLKVLQNSQENACVVVSFYYSCKDQAAGLKPATLLKNRLGVFLWVFQNASGGMHCLTFELCAFLTSTSHGLCSLIK